MKIALYINSFGPGGAEHVLSRLSELLCSHGHDVYLIIADTSVMAYEYSGNLCDLELKTAHGMIGHILMIFRRILRLRKLKRQYEFDFVVSFLDGANLVNSLTPVKKVKNLVSIRNFQSSEYQGNSFQRVMLKLIYKKADGIIACSKAIAQDVVENFGAPKSRVRVLYNPFDSNQIIQLSQAESPEAAKAFSLKFDVTLVTTGRMNYQKGYNHLLRILKGIRDCGKNYGLIMVGDGKEREKIENLISQLDLDDAVFLAGYQKNPYTYEKYADAYVMTSLFEGFPNALAEAMILGLPVISADCKSGPREILAPDLSLDSKIVDCKQEFGILMPVLSGSGDWNIALEPEETAWVSILSSLTKEDLSRYTIKSKIRGQYFSQERCYENLCSILSSVE